eukprot:663157-Rhodomonas_salina.1
MRYSAISSVPVYAAHTSTVCPKWSKKFTFAPATHPRAPSPPDLAQHTSFPAPRRGYGGGFSV